MDSGNGEKRDRSRRHRREIPRSSETVVRGSLGSGDSVEGFIGREGEE